MSLEEAERWPELLKILRERVMPERDKNNRDNYRRMWWRFAEYRPGLYDAIVPLKRCLVTSFISKHRAFAFQTTDRVWSHNVGVFALDGYEWFSVLQSRIHIVWASLLSSTLEDRSGYRPSDCFETFPFPGESELSAPTALERAGKTLYEGRAMYMVKTQQGLTQTYNKLNDPNCTDAPIVALRRLHEAMDRAVLDAYGWNDIAVPPYGTPAPGEECRVLERFEDEVIDRLFALNAERAEEEHRGAAPELKVVAASKSAPQMKVPGLKKTTIPPPPPARRKAAGGRGTR
jgi:hypothetical protein